MCIDFEPADVFRREHRTAAKPHKCTECGRVILKGEQHDYVVMLCDGFWSRDRVCAHCKAAARWLWLVCGGYGIGGLSDELWEHWHEDPLYRSHWLGRAIIGMRLKWRGMEPPADPLPMLQRRGVELSRSDAA